MAAYTPAVNRLNGSFGHLQINGVDWGEVTAVQIGVEVEYADVRRGMDLDKKMVGRSGSGSFTVVKAFSRNAEILESIKNGVQPTARLVAWVDDPDATGGQVERVSIDNLKFTTIDILSFTHGELMNSECPFVFAPSDLTYLDQIQPA